jgi:hypothetical protein
LCEFVRVCVRVRACVRACVGTLIEAVVGATGCEARDTTYAGRAIWMSVCVCVRACACVGRIKCLVLSEES